MLTSAWNSLFNTAPQPVQHIHSDILALARTIDKPDADHATAMAISAVALAEQVLWPIVRLAKDLPQIPGRNIFDPNAINSVFSLENRLFSYEEQTKLVQAVAQDNQMPYTEMNIDRCAQLYNGQVINQAKILVKKTLGQDAQFLTDEALDAVIKTIIRKKFSAELQDPFTQRLPAARPWKQRLEALSPKILALSELSNDDYIKIGTLWGTSYYQQSFVWMEIAQKSRHTFYYPNSDVMQTEPRVTMLDDKDMDTTGQVILAQPGSQSSENQLQVKSSVNIGFKSVIDTLPENFGLNLLAVYHAACEMAQPHFNLANKMMGETSTALVLK